MMKKKFCPAKLLRVRDPLLMTETNIFLWRKRVELIRDGKWMVTPAMQTEAPVL